MQSDVLRTIDTVAENVVPTPDIEVVNEGSIFLFRPHTAAGEEWLREHTDGMWFGNALAVEHRYAGDLAVGAIEAGLEVV